MIRDCDTFPFVSVFFGVAKLRKLCSSTQYLPQKTATRTWRAFLTRVCSFPLRAAIHNVGLPLTRVGTACRSSDKALGDPLRWAFCDQVTNSWLSDPLSCCNTVAEVTCDSCEQCRLGWLREISWRTVEQTRRRTRHCLKRSLARRLVVFVCTRGQASSLLLYLVVCFTSKAGSLLRQQW